MNWRNHRACLITSRRNESGWGKKGGIREKKNSHVITAMMLHQSFNVAAMKVKERCSKGREKIYFPSKKKSSVIRERETSPSIVRTVSQELCPTEKVRHNRLKRKDGWQSDCWRPQHSSTSRAHNPIRYFSFSCLSCLSRKHTQTEEAKWWAGCATSHQ